MAAETCGKRQRNEKSVSEIKKSKYFNSDGEKTGECCGKEQHQMGSRLLFSFFDKPCPELAKSLLGKHLVRVLDDGTRLCAKILETEAYLGVEDKASHSYQGKKTKKNEAMFMPPGTLYVYMLYGMCCMNISSKGEGAAVLMRALEPISGHEHMQAFRSVKKKSLKEHELCNGPCKLCQALSITKEAMNKVDLTISNQIWLEDAQVVSDVDVMTTKRMNIDYADDWTDKPLRFYVLNNKHVSVRDKAAERAKIDTVSLQKGL